MSHRTPNRISESESDFASATDSHVLTDGRTKKPIAEVDPLTVVTARATGIESIGEVLARGIWITDQRHPIVRTGEREPIPSHVRSAVFYRDHGMCELCGNQEIRLGDWHLDHITPWSAGGSDDTTNLRILCERHNMDRSNYVDPTERPRRAATWWCVNCYTYTEGGSWWLYAGRTVWCSTHRDPKHCRVAQGYRRMWELHGEAQTWHDRPSIDLDGPLTPAFCAHCGQVALTDKPL